MKFNGYDIHEAEKKLNIIQTLTKTEFEEWKNKKQWAIARYHYDNNPFYKNLIGKYFPSKWEDLPIMEKENYDDGEAKVGEILSITNDQCQILVNEKFDFNPKFITTYYNDSNDKINNIGLYNAFFDRTKIYDIFYNDVDDSYSDLIEELNIELILGPPGSGKTTTICNNIITSLKNGETIFVTGGH